mgnify:CR=1 FL=1
MLPSIFFSGFHLVLLLLVFCLPAVSLSFSCCFPIVFLWLSWASPVVFCLLACCFPMAFSWRSCCFPMVFLCLSYVFPVAFLRFSPNIFHRKIDQKMIILGCLEVLFWLFLVSWGLLGPKLVPKVFWRGSWGAFWPPFGSPWANFFRHFWMEISSQKKLSFQTKLSMNFGPIVGQ